MAMRAAEGEAALTSADALKLCRCETALLRVDFRWGVKSRPLDADRPKGWQFCFGNVEWFYDCRKKASLGYKSAAAARR